MLKLCSQQGIMVTKCCLTQKLRIKANLCAHVVWYSGDILHTII